MVLYINCAIHAPGVKFGQAPEVDSLNRLAMGKKSKIFFSETTGHTALIFCMWQWLMVLYINCASHAPGVKFDIYDSIVKKQNCHIRYHDIT